VNVDFQGIIHDEIFESKNSPLRLSDVISRFEILLQKSNLDNCFGDRIMNKFFEDYNGYSENVNLFIEKWGYVKKNKVSVFPRSDSWSPLPSKKIVGTTPESHLSEDTRRSVESQEGNGGQPEGGDNNRAEKINFVKKSSAENVVGSADPDFEIPRNGFEVDFQKSGGERATEFSDFEGFNANGFEGQKISAPIEPEITIMMSKEAPVEEQSNFENHKIKPDLEDSMKFVSVTSIPPVNGDFDSEAELRLPPKKDVKSHLAIDIDSDATPNFAVPEKAPRDQVITISSPGVSPIRGSEERKMNFPEPSPVEPPKEAAPVETQKPEIEIPDMEVQVGNLQQLKFLELGTTPDPGNEPNCRFEVPRLSTAEVLDKF
jgi:hypothetical protein